MFFNQLAARSPLVPSDKHNLNNTVFFQIMCHWWGWEKCIIQPHPIAVIVTSTIFLLYLTYQYLSGSGQDCVFLVIQLLMIKNDMYFIHYSLGAPVDTKGFQEIQAREERLLSASVRETRRLKVRCNSLRSHVGLTGHCSGEHVCTCAGTYIINQ